MDGCRILLVDDETAFLEGLQRRLRHRGLDTDAAANGREAMKAAMEKDYDLIVLDINLGDMNGLDVLKELKSTCDAGVLMLSGHAHTDLAVEAMSLGCGDFLLKPCPLDELLEKLEELYDKVLETRKATRSSGSDRA